MIWRRTSDRYSIKANVFADTIWDSRTLRRHFAQLKKAFERLIEIYILGTAFVCRVNIDVVIIIIIYHVINAHNYY